MPTRDAYLHVFVVDPSGKPVPPPAGAIALRPAGSTSPIAPDKAYSEAEGVTYKLSTRDVELVVAYPGRTELHQWFTAVAPAEQPKLVPYWPGTDKDPSAAGKRNEYLLECMAFQRVAGGATADRSPSVFHVTVALHPMRELVSAIGTDYWEGPTTASPHRAHLDFTGYSLVYAQHLTAADVLNPCSPYTVLSCDFGKKETWMRTRVNGWRMQRVDKLKDPVPAWTTPADFNTWYAGLDATKYLGALDIYQYLHAAGTTRPGTVADFSIFSHAWAGGPILYNTGDYADPAIAVRAPTDLDMRTKDFNAANSPAWANMPAAFTTDATLQVWGCFATTVYRDMVNYLGRTMKTPATKETFPMTGSAPLSRAGVIAELQAAINYSYMKALATFTHRPTYGGPPGYGAENIAYSSLPDIPAALKKRVTGKILHIPNIIAKTYTARKVYDSGLFGSPNWNYFGYMRYPP